MQQKLQELHGKKEHITTFVASCNCKLLMHPYVCEVGVFLHRFSYISKELANYSGTLIAIRFIPKIK